MGLKSNLSTMNLKIMLVAVSILGVVTHTASASPDPKREGFDHQLPGTKASGGGGAYDNELLEFNRAKLGTVNIAFDPKTYQSKNGQNPYEWIVENIYEVELLNHPSVVSVLENVFSAKAWYFINASEIPQDDAHKIKSSLRQTITFLHDETKLKIIGYQTRNSVVICKPWFDQKIESPIDSEAWLHGVGLLTHEAWINITMGLGLSDLVAGELNVMLFSRYLGGSFPSRQLGLYLKNAGLCPLGEKVVRDTLSSLRREIFARSNELASSYPEAKFFKKNDESPAVSTLEQTAFALPEVPSYRIALLKKKQINNPVNYLYSPIIRIYVNLYQDIINQLRPNLLSPIYDREIVSGTVYPATLDSQIRAVAQMRNLSEFIIAPRSFAHECELFW